MAIDRSQQWWTGDTATDIDTYLQEFTADGYPVADVVHAVCGQCGGTAFRVRLDDEEGVAERTCPSCGSVVAILDSADHLEDAELDDAQCPCGAEIFDVAAGFARYDNGEIRWVYIGLRCTTDGALGCYADWKIDYSPSGHLLGQV